MCRYLNERLMYGMAPDEISGLWAQRLRWTMGSLQILFRSNPLRLPGLNNAQVLFCISESLCCFCCISETLCAYRDRPSMPPAADVVEVGSGRQTHLSPLVCCWKRPEVLFLIPWSALVIFIVRVALVFCMWMVAYSSQEQGACTLM